MSSGDNVKEAVSNNVLEDLPVSNELVEMLKAVSADPVITVELLIRQFVE